MRNHVLPEFGEWQLAAIGPGDVERWTARLSTRGLEVNAAEMQRRLAELGRRLEVSERKSTLPPQKPPPPKPLPPADPPWIPVRKP